MTEEQVFSAVKDKELVEKRRKQMIQGALNLFKEKGFHRTTTREIAKESGFSIGTLYEYIRTKEDVLFLVCDAIYEQVQNRLTAVIHVKGSPLEKLVSVIDAYFRLMDEMQEEIVIMYQEVKSLKKNSKEYVLQKEREMVQMLEKVIVTCLPESVTSKDAMLLANNIFIQGQMWSFRRWMLHREFTIDEYIERQTQLILRSLS
ncbi:TetR/AcrR family transcriptional regulator [Oceanobacillus kapialis]|uniref:TetR/AcrR family transcriptional regulator n=1 Tax=Oceanobacillus kapialis TaxID=481353 RepID=A0ABW5Q109_9BACI